jgi:hypothetical protein
MDIDTIYPIHMQEKHTKENERAGWSVYCAVCCVV